MSQILIQQYLNQLSDLRRVSGTSRETVVREAFKDLLKGFGRAHDLIFVPEYEIETLAKQSRYIDGSGHGHRPRARRDPQKAGRRPAQDDPRRRLSHTPSEPVGTRRSKRPGNLLVLHRNSSPLTSRRKFRPDGDVNCVGCPRTPGPIGGRNRSCKTAPRRAARDSGIEPTP